MQEKHGSGLCCLHIMIKTFNKALCGGAVLAAAVISCSAMGPEKPAVRPEQKSISGEVVGTSSTFHITLVENGKDVLSDQDIASYDWKKHEIKLNKSGIAKWNSHIVYDNSSNPPHPVLQGSLYKKEFAVRIDEKELYRGKFWSFASSLSSDGIIILDVLFKRDERRNTLTLQHGYPGSFSGSAFKSDPRNNTELHNFLKKKRLLR